MTALEILAAAAARGFLVSLNSTGDGLILWPGDDPPTDLVDLIRSSKPQIIALLQAERGRINRWIADRLIDWPPEILPALPQADHCRAAVGCRLERRGHGALP